MSNLCDYKAVIDPRLYERIFMNDPKLLDSNVYTNRDFSGMLQQLLIVRNWEVLREHISEDELWVMVKLHEYRPSKLVFDGVTGTLIADSASQQLSKRYYYNALWSDKENFFKTVSPIKALLCILVLIVLFYYLVVRNHLQAAQSFNSHILDILGETTRSQQMQWRQ